MSTVVFVPSAPLLLFGQGPDDLSAALGEALAALPDDIVVVGAGPVAGPVTGSIDRTPYGAPGQPPADGLPLSLSVGRTLLGDRPHRLWGAPSTEVPEAAGYLVVGDGSAKRSEKAPGHLDERAASFDAAVATALGAADQQALAGLDPEVADELWVQGLAAWQLAARLPGAWTGRLLYAEAPYGVGYFVAVWTD